MKNVIILIAVIVMAATVSAADPNNMAKPTLRNPVTICLDESRHLVTVKFYIPDPIQWSWVKDSDFANTIRKSFYDLIPAYVQRAMAKMLLTATWEDAKAIHERDK